MILLKMILYIIAFIAVLFGTYFCCRFLASMQTGMQKSRYLSILDRAILSKDNSLQIVKVGERYLLLGITNNAVSVLLELCEDDLKKEGAGVANDKISGTFSEKMKSYFKDVITAFRQHKLTVNQKTDFGAILKKEREKSPYQPEENTNEN